MIFFGSTEWLRWSEGWWGDTHQGTQRRSTAWAPGQSSDPATQTAPNTSVSAEDGSSV